MINQISLILLSIIFEICSNIPMIKPIIEITIIRAITQSLNLILNKYSK